MTKSDREIDTKTEGEGDGPIEIERDGVKDKGIGT